MFPRNECEKLIQDCRQVVKDGEENIARMRSDHQQWLVQQEEKTQAMLARPIEQTNNAVSDRLPFNGQTPTQDELMKIVQSPERFGGVFQELDNWFVRDRSEHESAKQVNIQSTDRKWFGGDSTPTMEQMLGNGGKNLQEMLNELNRMESAS